MQRPVCGDLADHWRELDAIAPGAGRGDQGRLIHVDRSDEGTMVGGDGIEAGPAAADSSARQVRYALQQQLGEMNLGTFLALVVVEIGIFRLQTIDLVDFGDQLMRLFVAEVQAGALAIHQIHHHRHRIVERLVEQDGDCLVPFRPDMQHLAEQSGDPGRPGAGRVNDDVGDLLP